MTDRTLPEFEGSAPEADRVQTKLWSFDRAMDGGLPTRTAIEISGYTGSGKSSFGLFLCGVVDPEGTVGMAQFEDFDRSYCILGTAAAGFHGKIRSIDLTEKTKDGVKPRAAEDMLQDLCNELARPDTTAVMLDSVGAIVSTAELEGTLLDAQVGDRARIMAKFLRRVTASLRVKEKPAICVLTNHVHAVIGGRGTVTSGGVALQYLTGVRLRLQRSEEFPGGSLLIGGKIDKLKFKSPTENERVFKFFVIPGVYGVHRGLTAVFDCVDQGLAERKTVMKLNGKSMGYLSKLIEDYQDEERFLPFIKALETT